ncbi:hypothetical protein AZE42_12639 [Rhizopogon vesiculosus]|uniref:Uncharacterized protein n=1 Tax=Rhizopogon vesiculosus TaxID=180088 RepID=A0A1J8QYN6_9AGAM|nr:hypothetical protein AZE42_12639 [Rhizopogon vesiculosus]
MATILSVLHIDHSRDPHGHRIDIKPEYTGGLTIRPKLFQCSFESMNAAREGQLRAVIDFK